jgi:hypothetical protein
MSAATSLARICWEYVLTDPSGNLTLSMVGKCLLKFGVSESLEIQSRRLAIRMTWDDMSMTELSQRGAVSGCGFLTGLYQNRHFRLPSENV